MLLFSGIIGILFGLIVLLFSIYGKKSYLEKKSKCIATTEGTIIRFEKRRYINNSENHTYETIYYPVYEYIVNGKKYEVMGRYGKGVYYKETIEEKVYSLMGQKKDIFYNPTNYCESYVSGEDLNSSYKIAKILGIILLVIGIFNLLIFLILK